MGKPVSIVYRRIERFSERRGSCAERRALLDDRETNIVRRVIISSRGRHGDFSTSAKRSRVRAIENEDACLSAHGERLPIRNKYTKSPSRLDAARVSSATWITAVPPFYFPLGPFRPFEKYITVSLNRKNYREIVGHRRCSSSLR